jgi:hypothetical protein
MRSISDRIISKTGQDQHLTRYNYASEAAIKEKLHAVLVKHRVLFLPDKTEMKAQA